MRSLAFLVLAVAACSGGSPTVIDGSSPEAFAASAAQARRDLPDAERLDYDAALKNPPGRRFGDTDAEIEALARETYSGMTAREVLDGPTAT